jgi:hypothetical protein
MRSTRRRLCSAIVVGAFVCMPVRGTAKADLTSLSVFTEALKHDGFDVTPGAVEVWNMAADWCAGNPDVEHAWYTNNAPYLRLMVPESAGDPSQVQDFQLARDEAIVLIGVTPPPAKYFGFYAWVTTKVYPAGERRTIVGSVVDPINNATIKTTGPTPFDRPVVLIFTPDRGTDARVRSALRRAGYPEAIINTFVFPASALSLGHGADADVFRFALRTAIWVDEDAGESYIVNAPRTQHLLRVTPRTPTPEESDPFPMPPLRIRGTGHSELYLWNKLAELRKNIIAANPGLQATDIPLTVPFGYEGIDHIQRGTFAGGGDARDAFCLNGGYLPEFGSNDQFTLADDEFLMVFGANHVATGKATYMSINVYTGMVEDGKLAIGTVDDRAFAGTARRYFDDPADPASDVMYAYKISRKCGETEPQCLPLSAPCDRVKLGPTTVLGVLFRMYLEPATKTGPVMPEVLYDRMMKFSPRDPARQ